MDVFCAWYQGDLFITAENPAPPSGKDLWTGSYCEKYTVLASDKYLARSQNTTLPERHTHKSRDDESSGRLSRQVIEVLDRLSLRWDSWIGIEVGLAQKPYSHEYDARVQYLFDKIRLDLQ